MPGRKEKKKKEKKKGSGGGDRHTHASQGLRTTEGPAGLGKEFPPKEPEKKRSPRLALLYPVRHIEGVLSYR